MKYIILMMMILTFSGCINNEPKVIIKHKYYNLNKNIMKDDVNISRPPDKEKYINSNPIVREMLLRNYILKLYGNINSYRIKLSKLNKQDNDIRKIIKKEIKLEDTK